jgi:hypothetical protein
MKKITLILALVFSIVLSVPAQTKADSPVIKVKETLSDFIELEQGVIRRHLLTDLPGSIVIMIPNESGKLVTKLLGDNVLKNAAMLLELKTEPTELIHYMARKKLASTLSYLDFISTGMKESDEVKFSVFQTNHTTVTDNDIDWAKFNARITSIKKEYPTLPKETIFAVVRGASVVAIDYQVFKAVSKSAKISGYGYSGNGKYLTENAPNKLDFKVGVSLTYPDAVVGNLINTRNTNIELKDITKAKTAVYEPKLNFNKETIKVTPENKDVLLIDANKFVKHFIVGTTDEVQVKETIMF